jgi:hypothetical protein
VDLIKRFVDYAVGFAGGVHTLYVGAGAWLAEEGWNIIFNRDRRRLSKTERTMMEPFFPDLDLEDVRLCEDAVLLAPPSKRGITIGNDIFMEGKLSVCNRDKGFRDASFLMHELVHVRQYKRYIVDAAFVTRYVMDVASPTSELEGEAEQFEEANKDRLKKVREAACAGKPVPKVLSPRAEDWGWILLG